MLVKYKMLSLMPNEYLAWLKIYTEHNTLFANCGDMLAES